MIYHDGQCPTRCVCDNPFKDGSGIKANVFLGKGLPILKFEGRLALVVTKEQCDAACAELRHRAAAVAEAKSYDAPLLGLDTETVTYLPPHHGEGTSSSSAAIAQLIADEEFGVIFALHKWPHVYASFKELMEDERIQKIANNIAHDVRHLSSRFPGLTIKSHVELSTRVKQLHPVENYKLSTLVCSLLEKRIDKRIDHRWRTCAEALRARSCYVSRSGSGRRRSTRRGRRATRSSTHSHIFSSRTNSSRSGFARTVSHRDANAHPRRTGEKGGHRLRDGRR